MIVLATGLPSVSIEGDRIILTVPSGGKDHIRIALTVHQALFAQQDLTSHTSAAMDGKFVAPEAQVLKLPRKRTAGGRV